MSGKTIWLTEKEFALVAEGRDLFTRFTGVRISWGAYLCALSIGALAAKSLNGLLMRCPDCGSEVEMRMVNPQVEPLDPTPELESPARGRQGLGTAPRSRSL